MFAGVEWGGDDDDGGVAVGAWKRPPVYKLGQDNDWYIKTPSGVQMRAR